MMLAQGYVVHTGGDQKMHGETIAVLYEVKLGGADRKCSLISLR